MATTYTCQDCFWSGEADELVDNDDTGKFDQCPRCGGRDLQEEDDE